MFHHISIVVQEKKTRPKRFTKPYKHHNQGLAITSTYLPPLFLALTVPPFLGPGAPSKSSMLLALLILVAGRLGGAEAGGPPVIPPSGGGAEADGKPVCGVAGDAVSEGGPEGGPLAGVKVRDGGPDIGGPAGGAAAPLALLLGGPLGGGGVAADGVAASAPPFLLIHFLRSGS
jgi:hypothetical protein